MKKTVLITGASSGFGKESAKLFQQKGWNVIASMRSPEKEQELTSLQNVLVVKQASLLVKLVMILGLSIHRILRNSLNLKQGNHRGSSG